MNSEDLKVYGPLRVETISSLRVKVTDIGTGGKMLTRIADSLESALANLREAPKIYTEQDMEDAYKEGFYKAKRDALAYIDNVEETPTKTVDAVKEMEP